MRLYRFRTEDHPEANGRKQERGDKVWDFKFTLEDGSTLILQVGKVSHDAFKSIVMQEEIHDAADEAQGII